MCESRERKNNSIIDRGRSKMGRPLFALMRKSSRNSRLLQRDNGRCSFDVPIPLGFGFSMLSETIQIGHLLSHALKDFLRHSINPGNMVVRGSGQEHSGVSDVPMLFQILTVSSAPNTDWLSFWVDSSLREVRTKGRFFSRKYPCPLKKPPKGDIFAHKSQAFDYHTIFLVTRSSIPVFPFSG